MEYIVKIKDVCKGYIIGNEEVKILKNINMEIEKGSFISYYGPSGSGKSTLLYLIGSLDTITLDEIIINNKQITLMTDKDQSIMRRRELGFVFQFYNLIPNLSVEENIALPLILDGKKVDLYKSKIYEILEIVGLQQRRKHTPRELFGGQQQRVAIARALINEPEIILADEPTGNLDSKSSNEIMELFKKINKETGKTIIQVTHSSESAKYGNRVIYLKDGEICK